MFTRPACCCTKPQRYNHLSSQCFYKDLRVSTKYDNQVKSRFIRNIIATQKTAIFLFLPVEDKTLLIWRDPLFVLNFLFYFLCGVWLEIQPQSDCLFRFVRHLEDLGVVVALRTFKGEDFSSVPQRKHGYWLGLLQLFEVNSPVSQLNLSSIAPTVISWIFSQDIDSWPIALLTCHTKWTLIWKHV